MYFKGSWIADVIGAGHKLSLRLGRTHHAWYATLSREPRPVTHFDSVAVEVTRMVEQILQETSADRSIECNRMETSRSIAVVYVG